MYVYGQAANARAVGQHGAELARQSGRNEDLRRFHLLNGVLQSETGDRGLALQSYVRALEIASALDNGEGIFAAWNNLAALFVDSGLYEEALPCANKAYQIALDRNLPHGTHCGRALANIASALYWLGDHKGSLEAARKSIQFLKEPHSAADAASRIVREMHLILALISCRELKEARVHVVYLRKLLSRFPSPRNRLVAANAEGLYSVMAGHADEGIRLLEESVSASCTNHCAAYPEALAALALAYEAVENFEDALRTTGQLVRYLESIHLDTSVTNLLLAESEIVVRSPAARRNRAELKRVEAELQSRVLRRELTRSRQEILERMAVAADIREDISGEHGYRVGRLSALLARELGWDRESCNALDIAARLHDIGKIGIPEKILLDERTLREAEKHFIASHTMIGAEILSKSDIPQVRVAEEVARCHHEWWDGSGYPRQLKGLTIPRSARIVALADAFDAMTHGRPYASAIPIEAALDQIAGLRGRQFDPEMTDHFLALVRRLATDNPDLDGYLGKAARNSPFLKARARIKEMLAQGRESIGLSSSLPPPGTKLN